MGRTKQDFLQDTVQHIDITRYDVVDMIDAMGRTAFQARNLHRAATIYDRMLSDDKCAVILCLAGSVISAGQQKVVHDMVRNRMADVIVSTGANIVDQDFFEGLGFKHYLGTPWVDDNELRELHIDRIYDTYIDEDELRICDDTCAKIADSLEPRPYSSREFIREMGRFLVDEGKGERTIVRAAYECGVPIFCPAFSDCSAGFGLVYHQWNRPGGHLSIDSAKDFLELTQIKVEKVHTGILMVGGGVPKNFTQDVVVAADILGKEVPMHEYAIQITVADERDGGLSGSTLKEASSWGKVETANEQMVYGEATVMLPLLAAYAYHKGSWKTRNSRNCAALFEQPSTAPAE